MDLLGIGLPQAMMVLLVALLVQGPDWHGAAIDRIIRLVKQWLGS